MVALGRLLPQLIRRLACSAGKVLRARQFSLRCCPTVPQPGAGPAAAALLNKHSPASACTPSDLPSHLPLVVVPCRCYSHRPARNSGRRMNALMPSDRWRSLDSSLAARRRVVLLLMVQSYCRHDNTIVPIVSFNLNRARAGCLVCLTLVGIGLASAIAYRLCCKYLLPPADCEDEASGDSSADDGREADEQLLGAAAHRILRDWKVHNREGAELLLQSSRADAGRGSGQLDGALDATAAVEVTPQRRSESAEEQQRASSGRSQHQQRILCVTVTGGDAVQTPSDPLSFSDESQDEDAEDDDTTVAEEFRRRLLELQEPQQHEAVADSEDSSSCCSSQLGSLRHGVSLFSEYTGSSAATISSVVMDDSGVDFLCETGGESRAQDHTLVKLDKLMVTLEQVRDEAGGMCQSCESLQAFANSLHSGVAEFDRSLQRAQLLCEEVSASDRQPVSRISQSSSFGLDADLAAANWSAYDEAVQERIAELFSDAGLEEILTEDEESSAQPEATSVGPLVGILEYAACQWGGGSQNNERVRRGYARVVADGSASFIRRIRDDEYCALRAGLFSFFLQVAELPQSCQHWLQHLSRAFAAHPWLSEWPLPPQLVASAAGDEPPLTAEAQLSSCVRRLYSQLASVRSQPGSLYREWEVLQVFNGQAGDTELLEAAKVLLLLRAAELHSACECGSAPVHAHLLFARDTSASLRDLFRNHICPIGRSAGLGQAELLLLADLLQAGIRVYRPFVYGAEDDFVLRLGPCEPAPQLQLVSEYDTRYHVLLA